MKALVIDTNVFLLLVVGLTSPKYISKYNRLTNTFSIGDFDVLADAIAGSSGILATPNILTEVSNFLRQPSEPIRSEVAMAFRIMLDRVAERFASSVTAVQRSEYAWLGLADAATLEILDDNTVLLTTDGPLCSAAWAAGRTAILFDVLRQDYHEGRTVSW